MILAIIKDCLAKNKSIRSLNYFDRAIAEAHEKRGEQIVEPEVPPDPAQVRRGQKSKARRFFQEDWPDNWTGKPGSPDCDIPYDGLIEVARECGTVWPPMEHARSDQVAMPVPPEAPGEHKPTTDTAEWAA